MAFSSSVTAPCHHLVTFLTRPLLSYPPSMVSIIEFTLETHFSAILATHQPFSFVLSAGTPPSPFLEACALSGIPWSEWIHSFGGSNTLSVRVSVETDASASFIVQTRDFEEPTQIPFISKSRLSKDVTTRLQSALASVRGRRSAQAATAQIKVPALYPIALNPCLNSDGDSDSDSDSVASSYSFSSSDESVTSISTSISESLIEVKQVSTTHRPLKSFVPSLAPTARPSNPPPYLSRSQRRLARATVDRSKNNVIKYLYQGGSTGVITGGVMLGGANTEHKMHTQGRKKQSVLSGAECENWRVRA